MPHAAPILALEPSQVRRLEQWAAAGSTPQQVALRCRIVLSASRGESVLRIAQDLGVQRPTVRLWRDRVARDGIGTVWDIAPGRGRKPAYGKARIARLVESTLEDKPQGATHWSTRAMAKAQGVSKSTVHRIWDDHQLKPHLVRSFKLSRDPRFVEKLTDVIGVYLTPPQNAIVLCVDEKSQIQALDRTQPGLPLKRGRCGTFTHDYKRHGTTTLFAALQVAEGKVIGECYQRHRHQEFLRFLKRLDREFPPGKALHLILDNYGTHGHLKVREWLARHPRFVLHFIPTSSSWLNLIERWFGELTQKSVRRGSFRSVQDLELAIAAFLEAWNSNPTPFVWTASVEKILEKVERCRRRLEETQPGATHAKTTRPTPVQSG
ncbi:MAG: IS630 family transposase [Verrucomicrobiota bacterium]